MRTPISTPCNNAAVRDTTRALRLIHKIEERYGLRPSAATGVVSNPPAEKRDGGAEPDGPALADEQMLVNEALVAKIFQCERAATALRESQQKLHDLLIHQLQLKEEERKRISLEIHDALGQNLLALRLDVASLSQVTGAIHPRLRARAACRYRWKGRTEGLALTRDLGIRVDSTDRPGRGDGGRPIG